MKKEITKVALAALITIVGASNTNASGLEKYVSVGGGSVEVAKESGTSGSVAFGGMGVFSNNVAMGTSVNFDYGSVNDDDFLSFDFDVKLGYSPISKLAIYGIIGVGGQNFDGVKAYGFGYGGGVEYRLTNSIAAAVEYKAYDMNPNSNSVDNYDYKKVGGYLKYYF
jgi:hypothetical protein